MRLPVKLGLRGELLLIMCGVMLVVAALVADERINMRDANAVTGIKGHLARVTATLEIKDAEQLSRILTRIERLPNVTEARRWHA